MLLLLSNKTDWWMLQSSSHAQLWTKHTGDHYYQSHTKGSHCQVSSIEKEHCSNYDGHDIIPDNTSSVWEEPWTHTASAAPSGAGSTTPITVTSSSAQLPPPLEAEKVPFSPSSIKQVKNLVSKENTNITLALIGADEVASHIDTTTQAFDVKTKKDSSDEES